MRKHCSICHLPHHDRRAHGRRNPGLFGDAVDFKGHTIKKDDRGNYHVKGGDGTAHRTLTTAKAEVTDAVKRHEGSKRVSMFGAAESRPVFGGGNTAKGRRRGKSEQKIVEEETTKGYRGGSLFRSGQGERRGLFDDYEGVGSPSKPTLFNSSRRKVRRKRR